MAHAEKCPVCGGAGKVKVDGITIDCHGCEDGKGWVTVKDEERPPPIEVVPYYPYCQPQAPWIPPIIYSTTHCKDTVSFFYTDTGETVTDHAPQSTKTSEADDE